MAPIFQFGGSPSARARRALRELAGVVMTTADGVAGAVAGLSAMTDDEIRHEIKTWIDDAAEMPEVRRVLSAYGF